MEGNAGGDQQATGEQRPATARAVSEPHTDCAVIVTGHDGVDYAEVARRAPVVVDTRNALAGVAGDHILRL